MSGRIQISRESTRPRTRESLAYVLVRLFIRYSAISTVRCSRACWWCVNSTSGSASSVATLSEIFTAISARPSYDVPYVCLRINCGYAATMRSISAFISA